MPMRYGLGYGLFGSAYGWGGWGGSMLKGPSGCQAG
jgi:hypothetical protein